jgi:hypothetical protein
MHDMRVPGDPVRFRGKIGADATLGRIEHRYVDQMHGMESGAGCRLPTLIRLEQWLLTVVNFRATSGAPRAQRHHDPHSPFPRGVVVIVVPHSCGRFNADFCDKPKLERIIHTYLATNFGKSSAPILWTSV